LQIVKTDRYINSLENIMLFISKDSVNRALEFEDNLNKTINNLSQYPYKYRKSIYFDDETIRDLIFKGYTVPYLIEDTRLIILGITKYQNNL
jgi:plasmid stabilization system protein ParE